MIDYKVIAVAVIAAIIGLTVWFLFIYPYLEPIEEHFEEQRFHVCAKILLDSQRNFYKTLSNSISEERYKEILTENTRKSDRNNCDTIQTKWYTDEVKEKLEKIKQEGIRQAQINLGQK